MADYDLKIASLNGKVSEGEWQTRVELAAAFRVAYYYGWNETINNHISARIPDQPDHFVMNPVGIGWDEVTASSLITADIHGNIVSDSSLTLAKSGQNFHTIVQRDRPDLQCIFHIHPADGVIISALKDGLQFFDQNACALYGKVGRHGFEGMVEEKSEGERIVEDIEGNYALIMANHGLLTAGRTIGEAFTLMQRLIKACDVQIRVMATGAPYNVIPDEIAELTATQMWERRGNKPFGVRTWPAIMRLADRLDPGYQN
jgi:ribulose-5-phosphate 4-epimerase/fuculose-1-phosphate aldolase